MGYRRLFIMRKDLDMSPGKLGAQIGHAAEAYWLNLMRQTAYPYKDEGPLPWDKEYDGETGAMKGFKFHFSLNKDVFTQYVNDDFTKTVCAAKSKKHLMKAVNEAEKLGLKENVDYGYIYDRCRTELTPEEPDGTTITGLWFAPLTDEISHIISKKFQLYK